MAKAEIWLDLLRDSQTASKEFEGIVHLNVVGTTETNQLMLVIIKNREAPIQMKLSWDEFFELWKEFCLTAMRQMAVKKLFEMFPNDYPLIPHYDKSHQTP